MASRSAEEIEMKGAEASELERSDDIEDDLCFGDIVTIYKHFSAPDGTSSADDNDTRDEDQGGFLGTRYGGTIDNNLEVLSGEMAKGINPIIENTSKSTRKTIPRNIRGCLFQVVPKLSYLEKAEGMETSVFKKEKSLEINSNREEIQFKHGQPVKFGDTIQLQHVLTGKFVTIRPKFVAPLHPSALKVQLACNGTRDCYIDIKARFLVRRAGDDVEFGDEVVLVFGSASDTAILDSLDGEICSTDKGKLEAKETSSWKIKKFTSHLHLKKNHLLYGKQVTFYYPALKRYLVVIDKNLHEKSELEENDEVSDDVEEMLSEAHFIKQSSDPNREMMVTLVSILPKKDPRDVHSKCIWLLENAFRLDDPDAATDGSTGGAVHFGDTTDINTSIDTDILDPSGLGDTITSEMKVDISEPEEQSEQQKKAPRHWVRLKHFNSGKYLGLSKFGDKHLIPVDSREDALCISLEPTTSQNKFEQIQLEDFVYMAGASKGEKVRYWLCAGAKSLGEVLNENRKPHLSLEQCEARCGDFWTEAIYRNIKELTEADDRKKVNQEWFEWFARQYGFEELLIETSFDALADAYRVRTSKTQVDQGAFQVSAVHEMIASEIHECIQTIRFLGRLTKHLYEGTSPTAAQAMKDVNSNESKTEQQQGVLMQQVVEAAAGLVFYVIQFSEEQVAAELKARDFMHRLQKLLNVDFDKSGGLPRRQRFVREQGGFEQLFKLTTWAAVGQAAHIALKMDKIGKTEDATKMIAYQIRIGKELGMKSQSLAMRDAKQVYKYLTNKKLEKPEINQPYAQMGHVFYSFMRQLFKNNRSVEKMVAFYLHIILAHFPLNIGAPATFACLTDNNRELLENRVEKKHIHRFLEMIQRRGMNPEFMRYLYSLCGYLDTALSSKQVSVCRLTLVREHAQPHSILMQTLVSDGTCQSRDADTGLLKSGLKHIDSIKLSDSGKPWLSWSQVEPFLKKKDSEVEGLFVAAEDNVEYQGDTGAYQLFLSWNSGKKGYRMERLYKDVIQEHYKQYGTKMIPLETICQVEKERQEGKLLDSNDKKLHIYQYYCNQLRLFCWLVKDRNYYSIEKIERFLPFELLVSAIINRNLTYEVRGLCTELINHVYLNRQPHHTIKLPIYTRGFLPETTGPSSGAIGSERMESKSDGIEITRFHSEEDEKLIRLANKDVEKFAVLQAFVNQHFTVGSTEAYDVKTKPMHNKVVTKGFENLQAGEVEKLLREAGMRPKLAAKLSKVTGLSLVFADDEGIIPLHDKEKLQKILNVDLLQVRKLQSFLAKTINACTQKKDSAAQFTTEVSLLASNLIAFGFYEQKKIEGLAIPIVSHLEQQVSSLIPDKDEEQKLVAKAKNTSTSRDKVYPASQIDETELAQPEPEPQTRTSKKKRLIYRWIYGLRAIITDRKKLLAFLGTLPYNIFMTIVVLLSIIFGVLDVALVYARYYDKTTQIFNADYTQKISYLKGGNRYFALFQIPLLVFVGLVLLDFLLRTISGDRDLDFMSVIQTLSAFADVFMILVLLSFTHESAEHRSLEGVTTLIIATIVRCTLIYRLYVSWPKKKKSNSKQGPALHEVNAVFKHRFDRVWFSHHMDVQDMHAARVFTPFGVSTHITKSIRLQLKLLHRISLLKQEQVFRDIIYALTIVEDGKVRIKPESELLPPEATPKVGELVRDRVKQHFLAKEEFDRYKKLYVGSNDYMLGCLLSLCLYPDTRVVSQAMSLLTTLHSKTQNLLKIAKNTRIISKSTIYEPFQSLAQKNQELRNLAESFETWGRLYSSKCKYSFQKVTGIVNEITAEINNHSDDLYSLNELKHSFLDCGTPDTVRFLMLLARDWYGNMSLTGGIQTIYTSRTTSVEEETKMNSTHISVSEMSPHSPHNKSVSALGNTIYLDNVLTPDQAEQLMLTMLKAICNLLKTVAEDYLPAKKELIGILPLVVPLFSRVSNATEVVKAVLKKNSHGVTELSDHFVHSLVISLRMIPPHGLLDFKAIDVHEELPSWSERAGWVDKVPDLFRTETMFPDDGAYKKLVEDIIEIMMIIMFNPDPIQRNQVRIIHFLSSDGERLKKEISLHLLKGSEYQKYMQESNWRNHRLVWYHLGMFKLMAHGCVGSINITEAKCLNIVELNHLLECAADEDIIWPIRAHLLLLLYHMAIDAEIKVRYLCHKPGAKKLLRHFGEVMLRIEEYLTEEDNREVFVRLVTNGEVLTQSVPRSEMLFLDPKSSDEEDLPIKQLNDEQNIRYAILIVLPCLYGMMSRYHEDLAEDLTQEDGFPARVRRSINSIAGILEQAYKRDPTIFAKQGVADFKDLLRKLGPLVQDPNHSKIRTARLARAVSLMHAVDVDLTSQFDPLQNLVKAATLVRDASSDALQLAFVRYIAHIKADDEVQRALRQETREVAKRVTSRLEDEEGGTVKQHTPREMYLRYDNIMYCLLQYVLSNIRSKQNSSDPTLETFCFQKTECIAVSLTIIKFLRKILKFIMWNAEESHDDELFITEKTQSFAENREKLERAKELRMPRLQRLYHKSQMKKARLSDTYIRMSVQGIPQAIAFGVVEFIVKLVRNGMPQKIWRKACKLGLELIANFPAHRTQLQKRLHEALSDPQNAPFFYGVKAMFDRAREFIQRRCEKVEARLNIDESDSAAMDDICVLLHFLQKLCEGHFLPIQKLLREQPQNRKEVNILQLAMDLLYAVLKNFKAAQMGLPLIEVIVTRIMSFFTEVVQGPCKSNQNWLLKSTTLGYCNKILRRLHDATNQVRYPSYRVRLESKEERDIPATRIVLEEDYDPAKDALLTRFLSNSKKMTMQSYRYLLSYDEEEEEDLAAENEIEDTSKDNLIGRTVTILPSSNPLFDDVKQRGTVLYKNVHYFGAKYEPKTGKRTDMTPKQLDSLLNTIEMKIVDLVLGLLEGREEPRKFKSAFRKMKESLDSFFMKDIWVAASIDSHTDKSDKKMFTRTRMVRRATKFTILVRTLATRSGNDELRWLDSMTQHIDEIPYLKPRVQADLQMACGRTDICSPDYLRVWMGLPDTTGQFDNRHPIARVESIEVMWYLPGATKPVLLPVMFPVPTGHLLLRKLRLDEVTDSLQNGNQKRKLQQLMTQYKLLIDEVKTLQWFNRSFFGRRISANSTMRILSTGSFYTSIAIVLFLVLSLVRNDTKETSGDFYETATSYKFDILFLETYGDRFLSMHLWKAYSNAVFARELETIYRNTFVFLKAVQLCLILCQLFVYLAVQGKADFIREGRDLLKCVFYSKVWYYCLYSLIAGLAFADLLISLTLVVFILEFIMRNDEALAVFKAIAGTRGNRTGLKLLGSTFVLLILFCFIFAMLMFQYSPHDAGDENLVCSNFYSCAILMLNTGLRNGGGIGESLWVYNFDFHPLSWFGLNTLFNFFFFIVVNAIMLNVVFGIIIDSFAARRDEQKEHLFHKINQCTICGLYSSKFVPSPLQPNPFRRHVKQEHNRWSYFKYILYLHEKDEDKYTGLEDYVWDLVDSDNARDQIRWFPTGTALNYEKKGDVDDDDEGDENDEDQEGDEDEEENNDDE